MFSSEVVQEKKSSWFGSRAPAPAPSVVPLPPKPGRPSARSSVRIATIAYKDQGVPAKVALEVAESLPEMFRGKDELVALCQNMSKKWGKSRSMVPLSAFSQAKNTLWSSLQRFVPWLERCAFADDFLCDLGVPLCGGAFTPSMRLVSIRRGRGWFLFRVRGRSDRVETTMLRAGPSPKLENPP